LNKSSLSDHKKKTKKKERKKKLLSSCRSIILQKTTNLRRVILLHQKQNRTIDKNMEKKLWHNNTLTQLNSPENVKTNRLVVVLSDSEISELFHFQIIGDILDMFWLSQHGACLTNKQTDKQNSADLFKVLVSSAIFNKIELCEQNFLLPPQSARNKGKL
jgi:hypothetical protein